MNKFLSGLFVILMLLITGCARGPGGGAPARPTGPVTLHVLYMAQAGYQPPVFEAITKDFEAQNPNVKVNVSFVKYDEQHEKIVTSAASPTATYDVIALDLVWTAEFASRNFVLPVETRVTEKTKKDISPVIWDAFTYQDHVWAMPFLANFQLFFYNKTMLAKAGFSGPPKTIEEWEAQMVALKKKKILEYPFSDSWNQKEGLVCEYVWWTGACGGETFNEKGEPVFNQGPGLAALETMVRWVKEGLVNPVALTSDEPAAKDTFLAGEAAFTSNWTFQYKLMKDPANSRVAEDAEMGLIPVSKSIYEKAKNHTATVSGFQGLAIMANSRNPEEAWQYITHVTSPKVQASHLEEMPVWLPVQRDQGNRKKDPVLSTKSDQIEGAHHRPKLVKYPEVSSIMQRYIHQALEQKMSAKEALDKAAAEIKALGN
ncbi:MAG: extracellular solute-binding protein [Armatimonadetes bacterium]|nr:extracellular solute-binding protein [Armatimonadota bacterium]